MSLMDDEEVQLAFEAAIIQIAKSSNMIRTIAKALVVEEAIMAPVERFVARKAREKGSEATQQSILIAPPLPPCSPDGLPLPDDDWKERKPRKYSRRQTKKDVEQQFTNNRCSKITMLSYSLVIAAEWASL